MRQKHLIAFSALTFLAAIPAHATVFSGAFGISGIAGSSQLHLAAPVTDFSFSLNPGNTTSIPVLNFTLTNTGPGDGGDASVSGEGLLVFTSPATYISSFLDVQISDTEYGPPDENIITHFSVHSATISFSTGEQLDVTFEYTGPTDAIGNPLGASGHATSGTLMATVTDVVVSPPPPPPPPPTDVDEPTTLALLGFGLAGLAVVRRRKRALTDR